LLPNFAPRQERMKLLNFLKDQQTGLLAMIPCFFGYLILALQDKTINIWFKGIPADRLNSFTVGLAFLVWGLVPVIIILRKEMPFIVNIKGKFAVIYGLIFLLISLYLGLGLITSRSSFYKNLAVVPLDLFNPIKHRTNLTI
jgi:hypothetical protein